MYVCRTVATPTMNTASEVIMSRSLSALMIFLIRDVGNMVVPGCFSERDCRCLIIRLGLFGFAAEVSTCSPITWSPKATVIGVAGLAQASQDANSPPPSCTSSSSSSSSDASKPWCDSTCMPFGGGGMDIVSSYSTCMMLVKS